MLTGHDARIAELEHELAKQTLLSNQLSAALSNLVNAFTEIDGSLNTQPGSLGAIDDVLGRLRDLHARKQSLSRALGRIAETVMPIGSYAAIESDPTIVVQAVQDMFNAYAGTLRLLEPPIAPAPSTWDPSMSIAASLVVIKGSLRACLHCGATPEIFHEDGPRGEDLYLLECSCGVGSVVAGHPGEIIAAWNRQAPHAAT